MYYCCGITDKGVMKHNEDAYMISDRVLTEGNIDVMLSPPFLAAVSDGVSGERYGEIASRKCLEFLSRIQFDSGTDLKKAVMNVHRDLYDYGIQDNKTKNMQATLCAIAIDENDNLYTVNVGDSRMYRYRRGDIKQISRDQSLVQLLYEEGTITADEKKTHVHKNIIFPVMGNVSAEPKPDVKNLHEIMKYGDLILICSDGLSDYVSSTEMEDILDLPARLPKRLEKLVKLAIENGTIVALCCYD